jgi:DNA-binding NarL/FixJ family response regulator
MQSITNPSPDRAGQLQEPIELTPRELQVLEGLVDGLTNQAIAVRLDISFGTVRTHVSNVLAKLNVTNRTQAALVAQERNLLDARA